MPDTPPSRACDACHLRKVRCQLLPKDSSGVSCRQCQQIRMTCTFVRPMIRNPRTTSGPARKRKSRSSVDSPASATTSRSLDSSTPTGLSEFADSIQAPTSHWYPGSGLRVERLCAPSIIWKMVEDYITILYPLLPVVHLPSFRHALAEDRATTDPIFFSLLTSICAQTAVLLPRRFLEYKSINDGFPYKTPAEFVHRCIHIVISLRDAQYFETPAPEKAAIAYALGYAATVAGISGRSLLFWTELATMMKQAGIHNPEYHNNWNCIELQLWRKLFWMWFIIEAHARIGDIRPRGTTKWKPVPDTMFFNAEDAEALLPVEVDDEYITKHSVATQPPGEVALIKGFNVIARIYQCFMVQPAASHTERTPRDDQSASSSSCTCCTHGVADEIRAFEHLYFRIQNVLNDLPQCLAPWQDGDDIDSIDHASQWEENPVRSPANPRDVSPPRRESFGSMRANIHITQLWCRFVIAERLFSIYEQHSQNRSLYSTMLLPEHEFLCRQLLYLLSNISFKSLESNGISITFKIRQIAALFLQYQTLYPDESHTDQGPREYSHESPSHDQVRRKDDLAHRAQMYIEKFMDILTRLDAFTFQDTQQVLWNATPMQISA